MVARVRTVLLLVALLRAGSAAAADEVHWTFSGTTSVTFDWRGPDSTIRYGPTSAYGTTRTAIAPSPMPFSSAGPYRQVRLTGLSPATTYHYAIGPGSDHTFHTVPARGLATFTIFVEGDIGDAATYPDVAHVQDVIASGRPDFVFMVGDLTYGNQNGQPAVDRHFDDVMVWSQDAASMPSWGNHEWFDPLHDDLRNYKGRFELPNAETSPGAPLPGCCGKDWSWFDYGHVRFISYPEPYSASTWPDWLSRATALMGAAQADTSIRFVVTFGHRTAYSSGGQRGEPALTRMLDALGDRYGKYVLSVNGHSHDYERTIPEHGVTFITVGTGGSTLDALGGTCRWPGGCPAPPFTAFRAFHHGALRLRFTPLTIEGDMICAGGSAEDDISCTQGDAFDSFVITERAQPQPGPALAMEEVYPNPGVSLPTVVYSLANSTAATIELVDVAGRRILARDLGSPGPGRHTIDLSSLPAPREGVYWLQLRQSDTTVARKIVIVR